LLAKVIAWMDVLTDM